MAEPASAQHNTAMTGRTLVIQVKAKDGVCPHPQLPALVQAWLHHHSDPLVQQAFIELHYYDVFAIKTLEFSRSVVSETRACFPGASFDLWIVAHGRAVTESADTFNVRCWIPAGDLPVSITGGMADQALWETRFKSMIFFLVVGGSVETSVFFRDLF